MCVRPHEHFFSSCVYTLCDGDCSAKFLFVQPTSSNVVCVMGFFFFFTVYCWCNVLLRQDSQGVVFVDRSRYFFFCSSFEILFGGWKLEFEIFRRKYSDKCGDLRWRFLIAISDNPWKSLISWRVNEWFSVYRLNNFIFFRKNISYWIKYR